MTLARRLLLGSTVVIVLLVAAIVLIAGGRLRGQLEKATACRTSCAPRVSCALGWTSVANADSLAHAAGSALERRVTLIGADGVVRGDSRFSAEEIRGLENHSTRPEIVDARANGWGTSFRPSVSAGDDEIYVAVRHPLGFVRVSIDLSALRAIVWMAQRDVVVAGVVALFGKRLRLIVLFARSVSRPVAELRDVARAVADGDLSRRPHLDAPGEVGDLAVALHRMAEQLATRLAALQAEEGLMRATIEALDEGIIAVNTRHQVVRLNASARRMIGVSDAVPFPADHLSPDRVLRERHASGHGWCLPRKCGADTG